MERKVARIIGQEESMEGNMQEERNYCREKGMLEQERGGMEKVINGREGDRKKQMEGRQVGNEKGRTGFKKVGRV